MSGVFLRQWYDTVEDVGNDDARQERGIMARCRSFSSCQALKSYQDKGIIRELFSSNETNEQCSCRRPDKELFDQFWYSGFRYGLCKTGYS